MCSLFPFTNLVVRVRAFADRKLAAALLLCTFLLCPALVRAQEVPPTTVGRIEGNDISVEGGTAAGRSGAIVAPSIFVANGSIITVHSGQARLTLATGGEVDICGPAKLTLLKSGSAITLGLNFGRLRVQPPAAADLRIFAPTIIATPVDISGGPRDATVGLNLDDSLCVLATSGAIQLEHQFTGERLTVPQAGEFFISAAKLLPVAGAPGNCQCASIAGQPRTQPQPLPPAIPEMPVPRPPQTTQMPPPSQPSAAQAEQPEPNAELLAHARPALPVTPPEKNEASAAPPAPIPVYTVLVPPLTFSASSPVPPPDPGADIFLLVREAHVEPEWQFRGHVESPGLAPSITRALGLGSPAPSQPGTEPGKKKRGFWAVLRRIFAGHGAQD
jgi:hypothetical protein